MKGKRATQDRITKFVIQSGLESAAAEMLSVLKRSSMSPIIHEILDAGAGITDSDGQLVSSGAGIPTFVGVLDKAVQRILDLNDGKRLSPGDVFITNDPYHGGVTHLNDVVIAMPVFGKKVPIAWTASIAHWSDVGGMTPGSMSTAATEIIQEGLRLPAVLLVEGGSPVRDVFEIITVNSRMPDFVVGDLWSQVAACRRAAKRIEDLRDAYGESVFCAAIEDAYEEGHKRSLAGLAALPGGRHKIEQEQDDGAVWKACVTVSSKKFLVDLRDNPEQSNSPHNTSRDGAVISGQMVFKALCDPGLMANAGSFHPLEVLTKPGTIFHATGNAPHGFYFETRIRLFDMLWRCLAEAYPDRLPAGHFASICGTVIAGKHPENGRPYTMVEPQMGGWGGSAKEDGLSAMYSASHGETFNCPVEVSEARYGYDVIWRKLSNEKGGRGLHNGGRGVSAKYRMQSKATLSVGYSHSKIPVWGLSGGAHGGRNRIRALRKSGSVLCEKSHMSGVSLEAGDEIEITTAGGGGWGTP